MNLLRACEARNRELKSARKEGEEKRLEERERENEGKMIKR